MKVILGVVMLNMITYFGGHMVDAKPVVGQEYEELANSGQSMCPALRKRELKLSIGSDAPNTCPPHLPLLAGAICALAFA